MAAILYFHWNEAEARETVRELRAAGHTVHYHATTHVVARPPANLDAWVISLARLPSHGRAYAEWLRESKSRDATRIIFVGGAADKVAATRARFPAETYCAPEQLIDVLARSTASARTPEAGARASSAAVQASARRTSRRHAATAPRRAALNRAGADDGRPRRR
ncbi:MAG: hypothetical protein AB7Q17_15130 [Phycisphaerae bacterium]